MLKDNLYNDSINVLVFLFNFERNKKNIFLNYDPKFIKDKSLKSNILTVIDLHKILDITYSHTFKIVNEVLIPFGLVNVDKVGRCCIISLTEKGLIISEKQHSIFIDLGLLRYDLND